MSFFIVLVFNFQFLRSEINFTLSVESSIENFWFANVEYMFEHKSQIICPIKKNI
jgi:hypothetical protein